MAAVISAFPVFGRDLFDHPPLGGPPLVRVSSTTSPALGLGVWMEMGGLGVHTNRLAAQDEHPECWVASAWLVNIRHSCATLFAAVLTLSTALVMPSTRFGLRKSIVLFFAPAF